MAQWWGDTVTRCPFSLLYFPQLRFCLKETCVFLEFWGIFFLSTGKKKKKKKKFCVTCRLETLSLSNKLAIKNNNKPIKHRNAVEWIKTRKIHTVLKLYGVKWNKIQIQTSAFQLDLDLCWEISAETVFHKKSFNCCSGNQTEKTFAATAVQVALFLLMWHNTNSLQSWFLDLHFCTFFSFKLLSSPLWRVGEQLSTEHWKLQLWWLF